MAGHGAPGQAASVMEGASAATDTAAHQGALVRLARLVLRHRRLVIGFWLVLLVAGAVGAGTVSRRLSFDFSLPGQPGYETAKQIKRIYSNGGDQPPSILVVTVPAGETVRQDQQAIAAAFARVRQREPRLRVVDYAVTRDARFVTRDGRTTYALVFAPAPEGFGTAPAAEEATL